MLNATTSGFLPFFVCLFVLLVVWLGFFFSYLWGLSLGHNACIASILLTAVSLLLLYQMYLLLNLIDCYKWYLEFLIYLSAIGRNSEWTGEVSMPAPVTCWSNIFQSK